MNNFILLFIALLPVVLLGKYVYEKDKNKEPKYLLLKFFLLGILAAIMVFIISLVMSKFVPIYNIDTEDMDPLSLFVYVFIFVAFIEELCKWIFTCSYGYNNKEFDEKYDIIVYAVFTALGFAALENVLYIILDGGIAIGIYRGLLSVPGHVCFGIFMGYYLSIAKYKGIKQDHKAERISKIKSIIIPTILHGIYDYCCMVGSPIFIIIFIIFIIGLYIYAHKKLIETANDADKFIKNNFCPNCGEKISGQYCIKCGLKQE